MSTPSDSPTDSVPPVDPPIPAAEASSPAALTEGESSPPRADRVRIGTQRPGSGKVVAKAQRGAPTPTVTEKRVQVPNVRHKLSDEMELELLAALGNNSVDDLLGGVNPKANPELEPETRILGRVALLRERDVFVELGGRNQGVLSVDQFKQLPELGTLVEVIVDRLLPEEQIYQVRLPGGAIEVGDWSEVANGMIIEVRVTGHNKGGLECEVKSLRGFIPAGQISPYRIEDFSGMVGETLKCLVTECNPARRNLILSRRAVIEYEQEQAREQTWAELEEGQIREGTVRSLMDFGAFVDLGGVDGLIHISQMSWTRIRHPSEVLKLGDAVKVLVRKLDREARKVSLTLRDLTNDPWQSVSTKYPVTSITRGLVTRVMDFGAFVELEPGIEGLVHVSELSHGRVFRVRDFVKEGDHVEVKVMSIDPEQRRIGLSMKAVQEKVDTSSAGATAAEEPPPEPIVPKFKGPLKGGKSKEAGDNPFGLKW